MLLLMVLLLISGIFRFGKLLTGQTEVTGISTLSSSKLRLLVPVYLMVLTTFIHMVHTVSYIFGKTYRIDVWLYTIDKCLHLLDLCCHKGLHLQVH